MGASMERVKYPWWVTPAYALGGVVAAIIALGGPGGILRGTVSYQVAVATAVSLVAAVFAMFILELWSRRIVPPTSLQQAQKRGQFRLRVMVVLMVAGIVVLRTASQSQSGIFRAVIFGLFSGTLLGFAMVAQFDARTRPPVP
jgi:hypothetical protein